MKEVLLIIAGMSACGSAAYLLYLLAGRFFANRLGASRRYLFLKLAAIGFIVPLSLFATQLIPDAKRPSTVETDSAVQFYPAGVSVHSAVVTSDSASSEASRGAVSQAYSAPQISIDFIGALTAVWLTGTEAILLWSVFCALKFKLTLKRSLLPPDSEELELLGRCIKKTGVAKEVRLYRSPCVSTPTVIGFIRPSILLPQNKISQKSLEYVFLHELAHCLRGDLYAKAAISFTAALHWFNPLVWCFRREFIRQLELSCDEAAAKKLSYAERKEYCFAILEVVPVKRTFYANEGLVFASRGKRNLERRMNNMLNYKPEKKSQIIITAAVSTAVLLSVCTVVAFITPSMKSKPSLDAEPVSTDSSSEKLSYEDAEPDELTAITSVPDTQREPDFDPSDSGVEIVTEIQPTDAQTTAFSAASKIVGVSLTEENVSDLFTTLWADENNVYNKYRVSFSADGNQFAYIIDAVTGEIISPVIPDAENIPGMEEALKIYEAVKQLASCGEYPGIKGIGIGAYDSWVLIDTESEKVFYTIRDCISEMGYDADMLINYIPNYNVNAVKEMYDLALEWYNSGEFDISALEAHTDNGEAWLGITVPTEEEAKEIAARYEEIGYGSFLVSFEIG